MQGAAAELNATHILMVLTYSSSNLSERPVPRPQWIGMTQSCTYFGPYNCHHLSCMSILTFKLSETRPQLQNCTE